MAIRKTDDITNDPNINDKLKTTTAKDEILQRFNATKTDNILPCDDGLAYLSEKIDQCIDSINPNVLKVGITSTQASQITANTVKVGMTVNVGYAITFNVSESRGSYSLAINVTSSKFEGTKTAEIALK